MLEFAFEKKYSFAHRFGEAERIMDKYPDRVPIIVERAANSAIVDIDKHKFLVPKTLTMGQFVHIIRKRIQITPGQAIFLFINGDTLPVASEPVGSVYERLKSSCNFLYVTYSGENTFGVSH